MIKKRSCFILLNSHLTDKLYTFNKNFYKGYLYFSFCNKFLSLKSILQTPRKVHMCFSMFFAFDKGSIEGIKKILI